MSKSILPILCLTLAFCANGHRQSATMDNSEIEKMISTGDSRILSPQALKNIEKKEYPFVGQYLKSQDPDVRNVAIAFLLQMDQPWCYPLYLLSLDDPIASHRAMAAAGILKLSPAGKADGIVAAIVKEKMQHPTEEWTDIPDLISTIGNVGTSEHIAILQKTVGNEKSPDIVSAVQAALAKLGDEASIHEIENELMFGTPEGKIEALNKVAYIKNKGWTGKVVPLLKDKTAAMSFEIGAVKVTKRVCDYAINALLAIDSDKKIPLKPLEELPYKDEDLIMVKKLYNETDENR